MFLRNGFFLVCFLFGVFSGEAVAESFDRFADNPFVMRQNPLETHLSELKQAMRLSSDQEELFAAVAEQLRKAAQEREAASVAAAIDRNREPQFPKDPGAPLRARADRLSRHVESLRALADAETSFFASLSEEQRRIAELVLPKDILGLHGVFRRRGRRLDGNG
ncbi:MAG: amino acid ABC transporter substrate-binding protein [Methylocystaceae bacterium]|nr:MAG: amino acid ABC transporter substrate-binding protein [Methylocystaceae bacterium]